MTVKSIELQINGLTCGSCEKIVKRTIEKFDSVKIESFDFNRGRVKITADDSVIVDVLKSLKEKGYHSFQTTEIEEVEGESEVERFRYLVSQLIKNNPKMSVERSLIQMSVLTLMGSIALSFLFSIIFPSSKELLGLFLLGSIMVALTVFSIQHIQSFGKQSCSTGMMSGMGVGMMSGFMAGALIGASNGMFWGSIIGMFTGMILGVKIGRSCGNMGVLEGLMSGLMAGTMGAMLSVMLVFDRQFEFLIILWITCSIILLGLSYMMVKELGIQPKERKVNSERIILIALAVSFLLNLFMWVGPKVAVGGI